MLRPVVHALPSTVQTECDVAMMKRYNAAPVAVMHALPSTLQTECNVAMMKRYGAAPVAVMHALAPTLHAQSECCSDIDEDVWHCDMHASYAACLQAPSVTYAYMILYCNYKKHYVFMHNHLFVDLCISTCFVTHVYQYLQSAKMLCRAAKR